MKTTVALVVLGLICAVGAMVVVADYLANRPAAAEIPPPDPIAVTADHLFADYQANEVRADQQYRAKVLLVTGNVRAIRKDIGEHPYLELWTRDDFTSVHARFDNDQDLASLNPDMWVTVRCIGDNVVMGSPILKRCTLDHLLGQKQP